MNAPTTNPGGYPPPFLRITGTYPAAAGRAETVQVEMDAAGDVPGGQSLSDFCTAVIAALRRAPAPEPTRIVLSGPGLPRLLADGRLHAADCDGTCEQQADAKAARVRRERALGIFAGAKGRPAGQDAAAADGTGGA